MTKHWPARKHRVPLGTKVSFEGDAYVYETSDYQTVLECPPDCDNDHDCFTEPHICVSKTSMSSFPLSKLRTIFGKDGFGRNPTAKERDLDE
jgi:hypothetical protein